MEIPLFPLHTVLCPGVVLPLHVFEDRYRALVRHCVETGGPFGIVLIRAGREVGPTSGQRLASIGTVVEIREAGRYIDGRYDLLVAGTGRFAIETVDAASAPYLVGDVTILDEDVGDEDVATSLASAAIERFVDYLSLARARAGESEQVFDVRVEIDAPPDDVELATEVEVTVEDVLGEAARGPSSRARLGIPEDPTTLSYLLSGIVAIEPPRRQALLEAATTVDRLAALTALLDREILFLRHRLRLFAPEAAALVRRS
jgi:Lon protease-like protein